MKNKSLCLVFLILFIFIFSGIDFAQDEHLLPGLSGQQIKAVFDTASGVNALNHIRRLSLHHRWFVSDSYHEAASYVKKKAGEIGLKDVNIETFPSDGKILYGTDKSLPKWTVRSASLKLVSPTQKHLVSWAENPITLASYSRSGDVTAALIDVGEGTRESDYAKKDVRGKLVLASSPQGGGRIELVHKLAVLERGAAGVVSYRSYYLDDFPDLVSWDHIWTHELDGKDSTFGFCVSKRMGWELKRLLEKGEEVVLQAEIDADISSGNYEIVSGIIPGTDLRDQEIWFIAHLDHCRPSANDNASGSAAILETARTLLTLIENGQFERPRRTIRFLWVPEISGSYAYLTGHLEETRKAVSVINMDMVGQNQKVCGSTFRVTRTPDSSPSFFNDLLEMTLDLLLSQPIRINREMADPWSMTSFFGTREEWKARLIDYSGGSDHYIFMGGVVNIPSTMFGSWPDYFYHTSGDTPDKSDPTQLKRTVILGTMVAAAVARLQNDNGHLLLERISKAGLRRLDSALGRAQASLRNSDLHGENLKDALNIIHWTAQREIKALQSVEALLPGDRPISSAVRRLSTQVNSRSDSLKEQLSDFYISICRRKKSRPESIRLSQAEKAARKIIPSRNPAFPGPLSSEYIRERCRDQNLSFEISFTGFQKFEIDAFMDGKLNALEIRDAVSAECGLVDIEDVVAYLRLLEKLALISMK